MVLADKKRTIFLAGTCKSVADKFQTPPLYDARKGNKMELILLLLPIILELIKQCTGDETPTPEQIENAIRNPHPIAVWALARQLAVELGYTPREAWRERFKLRAEVKARIAALTPDQITFIQTAYMLAHTDQSILHEDLAQ